MQSEQSRRQYLVRQSLGRRRELQGRLVTGSSLDEVPLKRRCRDKAVYPRCIFGRACDAQCEQALGNETKRRSPFDAFHATHAELQTCERASERSAPLTSAECEILQLSVAIRPNVETLFNPSADDVSGLAEM